MRASPSRLACGSVTTEELHRRSQDLYRRVLAGDGGGVPKELQARRLREAAALLANAADTLSGDNARSFREAAKAVRAAAEALERG